MSLLPWVGAWNRRKQALAFKKEDEQRKAMQAVLSGQVVSASLIAEYQRDALALRRSAEQGDHPRQFSLSVAASRIASRKTNHSFSSESDSESDPESGSDLGDELAPLNPAFIAPEAVFMQDAKGLLIAHSDAFMTKLLQQQARIEYEKAAPLATGRDVPDLLAQAANIQALTHRALLLELGAAHKVLSSPLPEHPNRKAIYAQRLDAASRVMEKFYQHMANVHRETKVRLTWASVAVLRDVAQLVRPGRGITDQLSTISWPVLTQNLMLLLPMKADGSLHDDYHDLFNAVDQAYQDGNQPVFIQCLSNLLKRSEVFQGISAQTIKQLGYPSISLAFESVKAALLDDEPLKALKDLLPSGDSAESTLTELTQSERFIVAGGNGHCALVTDLRSQLCELLYVISHLTALEDPTADPGSQRSKKFDTVKAAVIEQLKTAAVRFNKLDRLKDLVATVSVANTTDALREAVDDVLLQYQALYERQAHIAQEQLTLDVIEADVFTLGDVVTAAYYAGVMKAQKTVEIVHDQARNNVNVVQALAHLGKVSLNAQAALVAYADKQNVVFIKDTLPAHANVLVRAGDEDVQAQSLTQVTASLSEQVHADPSLQTALTQHEQDASGLSRFPSKSAHPEPNEVICTRLDASQRIIEANLTTVEEHVRDLTAVDISKPGNKTVGVSYLVHKSVSAATGDKNRAQILTVFARQVKINATSSTEKTAFVDKIYGAAKGTVTSLSAFFTKPANMPASDKPKVLAQRTKTVAENGEVVTSTRISSNISGQSWKELELAFGLTYDPQLYRTPSGTWFGGYVVGAAVNNALKDDLNLTASQQLVVLRAPSNTTGPDYLVGIVDNQNPTRPVFKTLSDEQAATYDNWQNGDTYAVKTSLEARAGSNAIEQELVDDQKVGIQHRAVM